MKNPKMTVAILTVVLSALTATGIGIAAWIASAVVASPAGGERPSPEGDHYAAVKLR